MGNTQILQLYSISLSTLTVLIRGVSGVAPECLEYDDVKRFNPKTKEVFYGQCCEVIRHKDWNNVFWHSCEDEGGCCGDEDDQHCCDYDKHSLYAGLGGTAGALVILIIIFCIIYCCLKSAGFVFRCKGCCKCTCEEDSPIDSGIRAHQRQLEREEERRTQENGMFTVRDIPERHAQRYQRSRTPEVLSAAPPPAQTTSAPPSYEDVMNNPTVFPKTDKSADAYI